ncbi:MAG: DegT/DnrJ/EryC1/StrS aminotransferase family protein [Elusimicrobia bacterium]|nr:DegT/DnrJ/EryC1/StrS aminotransferase family protein [Elusimicrobiota bacterium]
MMDLPATVYAPPRAKAPWRVQDLFAPAALRFFGHGRNALVEALTLAGAEGGRVLLPSFVCRDLLSAVAAAGAEPAFYGVRPDLAPQDDPSRWPDARAVLAVDYFGWPQDLAPFEAYARRCGALVIEDAAHALFSRDAAGRLLGTRAPLGILSLRKSLPLPNGGALVAADPALAAKLPPQLPFEPMPGRRPALKAAARPFLALAGARATHAALTAVRALRGDASGHVGPDAESERVLPSPAAPCPELERPLTCADPAVEASRRRALWTLCDGLARDAGLAPVFPSLPDGVVPYAYAFRAKDLAAARSVFAAAGLTTLPWPDLPDATRASAPEADRTVGLAHFLW